MNEEYYYNPNQTEQPPQQMPQQAPQPQQLPPQQQYQQYQYNAPQQPVYPPYVQEDPTKKVMSVGEYIGIFILSSIPVVNIIMWIVWLVSPNTNKNKKNYIIAQIIITLICVVLAFIISVAGTLIGFSVFDDIMSNL